MKGKKIMAWLLATVLTTGILSPAYAAENILGSAQPDALITGSEQDVLVGSYADGSAQPEVLIENESLADSSLSDQAAEETIINEEDTDAVPDSATRAAGLIEDGADESIVDLPGDDSSKADDSSSQPGQNPSGSSADSAPTGSGAPAKPDIEVGPTYTSAVPADGKAYYIRCAVNKDLALTAKNSSISNGGNIVISTLTKGYNQKFMCRKLSDGTYVFTNFHSGKAIRIEGDTVKNSANLWQTEFNSANSGRWTLHKNADGSYKIASKLNTDYVFHVAGGKFADGTNMRIFKWCSSNAERFVFTETPLPDYSGTIQLRPMNAPSLCVSPAESSQAAGADIRLNETDKAKILTYTAIRHSAGYYILANAASGLVLAVKNSENKAGANVVQEKRTNAFSQQWLIRKNSDGTYSYISRLNSNLALTPKNGGTASDTTLLLANYKGYTSQKYYREIKEASAIPAAEVTIRSALNSDRVLDVSGGGTKDGTNIDCYDWNDSPAQKFKLEAVTCGGQTDYWYKITATASGKVVEVAGNSAKSGENIQLGTFDRTKKQLWHPVLKSDGSYILKSALNQNYCLAMTGSEAYGANVRLAECAGNAKQKWYFTSIEITKNTIAYSDRNTVTVRAEGLRQRSDTGLAYLFAITPYGRTINGYKPLASAPMSTSFIFHANLNKNASSSLLQRKFYIATLTHGTYTIISNGFYIQNPEASADNQKAFPTPARKTKKGLKTSLDSITLAKDLNCSHVVLDLPIDMFLGGSDLAYKYEGKTYYFSSIINTVQSRIKTYNDAGIVVTGIFYLSDGSNTDLMYPAAASGSRRGSSSVTLYALNTRNSNRKKLEALFACLADKFCSNGCTLANWIYGNELQQFITYHYAGDIPYSEYHEALAEEFRMFNASIKSRWRYARTYISLDHNWNLANALAHSYNGMQLTEDFNTDLERQGRVHWDMAMHPYPSPEQDCRFWNRAYTIKDSGSSQQITMSNARSFSSYIKKTYGSSTRIIMSETGLSSVYQGKQMQGQQAAAVAFAYYLAQFDSNIDMFAIHRDKDYVGETSGGWWLGLYHSGGSPKPSADVFRYMDTKNWSGHVSNYMNTYIGSNWQSQIHGFNADFFKDK
ncbi:MAG: DUF5722 domain-containing protein [Lachnospiraceae bacterium]|nr:DUF5722 domain-containing protein [Lachnospiraceae bacterium]